MKSVLFGVLTSLVMFGMALLSYNIGHSFIGFVGVGLALMSFSLLSAKQSMAANTDASNSYSGQRNRFEKGVRT